MTSHLEKEIGELKKMLLTMASHAEAAVSNAVRALVERDDELARAIIGNDDVVDRLEVEIDERVILLLTKAPLATDLRLMTVAMKLSHDLERVADEATTIARRAILLNTEPESGLAADIPRMAGMALGMLKDALDAFTNRQSEKARAIIPRDEEVDALNKKFHRDLTGHMLEQRGSISACLHLMVISKCLERIADQAASVAEEVVYLYEAEDIRHAGKGHP
jgi:phosphate transport system protein